MEIKLQKMKEIFINKMNRLNKLSNTHSNTNMNNKKT